MRRIHKVGSFFISIVGITLLPGSECWEIVALKNPETECNQECQLSARSAVKSISLAFLVKTMINFNRRYVGTG
jgi:hypothetical protein